MLQGYNSWFWSVAFSRDAQTIYGGSEEGVLKVWDATTGKFLKSFSEQQPRVKAVEISPNGKILASATYNHKITLRNNRGVIANLAFSPQQHILASASHDETIKVWDFKTGECLKTLRSPKLYENLNITGISGLTSAQKMTLKALGEVEQI